MYWFTALQLLFILPLYHLSNAYTFSTRFYRSLVMSSDNPHGVTTDSNIDPPSPSLTVGDLHFFQAPRDMAMSQSSEHNMEMENMSDLSNKYNWELSYSCWWTGMGGRLLLQFSNNS